MKSHYEQVLMNQENIAMIKCVNQSDFKDISIPQQIPPHWHRSLEFSYVRKGEVDLWINHQKEVVKEKEFILVNSGQIHKLESHCLGECKVVIGIISYQFIKRIIPHYDQILFDIHQSNQGKERLREIYEDFRILELNPHYHHRQLIITSHIYEILYILLNYYQQPLSNHYKMTLRKHDILDYIGDHYQENITLKTMSDIFFVSEEHFSRSFKDIFGINFKSFLTNYRLYCSFNDIVHTQKNIQDIAINNGFANTKAFINAFHKNYGLTPLQFRKQNQISKNDNLEVK